MRVLLIVIVTLLGTLLPLTGSTKVRVVSTIPDFGAIAQEVGGSLVEVASLVRPTQDPHFLDAKPSFVVDLNRAELLLLAGMELESGWLPPLLVTARNAQVQRGSNGYLDCSTLIPPMEVESADRSKGDVHPGGNPHYWFDPRNGVLLARGIGTRLALLDPEHADQYRSGTEAFVARLEGKMNQWRRLLAARKGTKVVVYHRSWSYFLDFAGYREVGALEPKPGIPPSPSHVAQLIRTTQAEGVRYMIQESFYPSQLSTIFASKSGASLKVLPTMTGAAGTKSYIDLVDTLVRELTQ